MSSGGGGGGSGVPANTTNIQTIREAPEIEARRLGLMDAATELARKPTTPPAFQIAPLATAETEGIALARSAPAGTQEISDAVTAAGRSFTAQDVQQAMNPFIENVVNQVADDYARKEIDLASRAIQSGNFGGGREGVGIAELQRTKADVLGGIRATGFQSALGELQTQRGLEAQTGLQAAELLQRDRDAQFARLMGAGGAERGVAQAGLEAARQTALQNIQEPFQRVAFVSDIQSGIPSTSQARLSQTTAPQPSPLGQAVGTGLGAYAAFSGR